jgi:hypothetical protein
VQLYAATHPLDAAERIKVHLSCGLCVQCIVRVSCPCVTHTAASGRTHALFVCP